MNDELSNGFRLGDWEIWPLRLLLAGPEGEHHVEPKTMEVLLALARQANYVVTRDHLLEQIWPRTYSAEASLTRCVSQLRHCFADNRGHPKYIETIPKRGYRLIAPIAAIETETTTGQQPGNGSTATTKAIAIPKNRRRQQRILWGTGALLLLAGVWLAVLRPAPDPAGPGTLSSSSQPNITVIPPARSIDKPTVTAYRKLSNSQVIMPPVSSPLPLLVDESRLYFQTFADGVLAQSQLAQSGGEVIPLAVPFDLSDSFVGLAGITPDKSEFVFAYFPGARSGPYQTELWVAPVMGGTARRLGRARLGVFSPSGKQLLFMQDSVMYMANADMSEPRKIATPANRVYWIRYSPDGTRVRFSQFLTDYVGRIWELKLDGSAPQQLLAEWPARSACCGSWTPDGRFYVFQARYEQSTQLWAIENSATGEMAAGEPFPITSSAIDFVRPTISSDGKTIFAVGWQLRGEVGEYDDEFDRFKPLPGLESMSVEQVEYSRDKQWVAYVSFPEGALWCRQLGVSRPLQLTPEPMRAASPKWSPDGSTIAFVGWESGGERGIFTVTIDGGNLSKISAEDTHNQSPSWSPDGSGLVFSESVSELLKLYDIRLATIRDLPGSAGLKRPVWSPDGQFIAGWARQDVNPALYDIALYDVAKRETEVVLENVRFPYMSWSADSGSLFLVDSFLRGLERAVYRLTLRDRSLSTIATIGKERNSWGTQGPWVGVKPDGTPIMLRDQSIHNIYALEWNPN